MKTIEFELNDSEEAMLEAAIYCYPESLNRMQWPISTREVLERLGLISSFIQMNAPKGWKPLPSAELGTLSEFYWNVNRVTITPAGALFWSRRNVQRVGLDFGKLCTFSALGRAFDTIPKGIDEPPGWAFMPGGFWECVREGWFEKIPAKPTKYRLTRKGLFAHALK